MQIKNRGFQIVENGLDSGVLPCGVRWISRIENEVVLAEVLTFNIVEVPAVMPAEVNVHVETGGQPAIVRVTCPESGGASVPMVNEADPPAMTDIETGATVTPPGNGPAKLKTVLPPHSAPLWFAAVHRAES